MPIRENNGVIDAKTQVRITQPPPRDIFLDYLEQVELPNLERKAKIMKYVLLSIIGVSSIFIIGVLI